jgi:molybdopterin-binding protein
VENLASIRICGGRLSSVPNLRISEAAALLGVSDDTVRRWIDQGRLRSKQENGRMAVDGQVLATFAQELADSPEPGHTAAASARNRMRGIVTRVLKDGVMAQVEMQAGPFRVVSLMSREAADELGLEPGVVAVASIKSTHVVVEIPEA